MSGSVRVGLTIFAVSILLCVALVVLIQTQLTPERVRLAVLPVIEKQLGRPVDLGTIEIGIFSGIFIRDLVIHEPQSADIFLTVGTARLSYRLWALFKGQLAIREILLDQSVITIVRNPDGNFNFTDLLPVEQTTATATDASREVETVSVSLESPFELLIDHISFRNGKILFIDKLINPAAPFRYTFSQLNLNVRQFSLEKAFPLDLSVVLNSSRIDLSAQINLARQSGEALLRLSPLDLIPFAPYYRNQLPGNLGSALLELNIDLDWRPNRLLSRGKITLDKVDMVLRELPDMPFRDLSLSTDYAIDYDFELKSLDVSTFLLKYNDIRFALQGQLDFSRTDPLVDGTLALERLDLRSAVLSLPQALTRQLQPFSPAGEMTAQMRLYGSVSVGPKLLHSAQIKLTNVQATVQNLRARLNGDISYGQDRTVSDNLVLNVGDQQARLSFAISNLLSSPQTGTFEISSRDLDLNQFLPEDKRARPVGEQVPTTVLTEELGPYDLPLNLTGTLTVERLRYRQLLLQQVRAAIQLKDNHLTVAPVQGRIGEGRFTATGALDLGVKGLLYQGEMTLAQPDLATLLNGLFPAVQQRVSGQVRWHNNFSGRGTAAKTLLQALQLDGEVQLSQGVISGSPLLEQISWFLDSPDLKAVTFRDFQGSYRMANGTTRIDSYLDGSQVKLTPKGTIGIDGSIDMSLATLLAPEVLKKMGASEQLKQAFVDSNGWGVLPLQISGSLNSPRVDFDTGALQKQALERAQQELGDRLIERLAPKTEEGKEPLKNFLDNTLRRLRVQ